MPRPTRTLSVVPDFPHHLILRGNNRRRLFSYPREYRFFSRQLNGASRKHSVPIHACALMANHVHLVVTPRDHQQLSRFVQSFAQSYAQARNRRRNATGKLFEQRYKSIPIRSEEQLAVTVVYIELNPVRAGLCAHPGDYPWTTYRQRVGAPRPERDLSRLWTPSSWYSSLSDRQEGRANSYRDWMDHYRARDDWSAVSPDPQTASGRRRFERPDRSSAV